MKILTIRGVCCFVVGLTVCNCAAPTSFAQVIVSDGFDDGDLVGGSDPLGLEWFENNATVVLDVQDDTGGIDAGFALAIERNNNQTQGAYAMLPETLTLNEVGDSISFSFDFRFSEDPPDSNRGLRAGLFDSFGTDFDFDDDPGYFLQLGTGFPKATPGSNNAPHLSARQELGLTNGLANGADNVGVPNDDPSIALIGINDLLPHRANLTLTRTEAGVLASSTVDSTTYSLEFIDGEEYDDSGNFAEEFLSFDEIVIHGSKGPFDFFVDNVEVTFGNLSTIPGDFDGNGVLDLADVNELNMQIATGGDDASFDLNADDFVNDLDLTVWVKDLKNTWFGDANLDGEFTSGDLIMVLAAGKFQLDTEAGWQEGDWDADLRFTTRDVVGALADGGFGNGPRTAVSAVPEPGSIGMLLFGIAGFAGWIVRRR